MEERKGLNGELKPGHKKTTNRTTIDPTIDINSQALTILNKLRGGPTHCRAIKEGSKDVNHNLVNSHAWSLDITKKFSPLYNWE